MSSAGAAPGVAASVSNARAEASRRNGAQSRGPKTPDGKARSAQNALKHGMRAQKYVVLPDEDAAEFHALEAALIQELAPVGALQAVLARRIAVAAWRLARADRIEADLFAERSYGADAGPGLAVIRDGNGSRSFETLLRYRGAAMAEFWRALRTLKALQAERAPTRMDDSAPRPEIARRLSPNEPKGGAERVMEYVPADESARSHSARAHGVRAPRSRTEGTRQSRSHLRASSRSGDRANPSRRAPPKRFWPQSTRPRPPAAILPERLPRKAMNR